MRPSAVRRRSHRRWPTAQQQRHRVSWSTRQPPVTGPLAERLAARPATASLAAGCWSCCCMACCCCCWTWAAVCPSSSSPQPTSASRGAASCAPRLIRFRFMCCQ